jgi:adenine-specific DNA-methyltransferase
MLSPMVTSTPVERCQRKSLGAFYSPPSLVEPMVAWALNLADQSVLDPSCGDGVFLEAAAHRLLELGSGSERAASLLHAVDLNPDAVWITRERVEAELGVPFENARVSSFFSLPPPGVLFGPPAGVDVILGNPPYIRYQEFAGGTRAEALERAAHAGVQLNRLASSWAHFVAHAMAFLRPGGRLALILPAELIHTTYAAPLRVELRRSFEEVHVISFRRSVFPEVQEEVVLLLAAGKGHGPGRLGLVEADTASDLAELSSILAGAEVFASGEEPEKWIPGYTAHPGVATLEHLQSLELLRPLGDIGKASIGFVSGANEYFVLTEEEAVHWRLPESSLRPALIRARQIPGLQITSADVRSQGERCLLWIPGERPTRAERIYIQRGEDLGYAARYKCRVRTPWYRVPGVMVPDAFLTYMSDAVPRLCFNQAQVVSSNTLHTIRLPRIPAALHKAFVVAFYNSATLLSCERTGRSYGGGVLKLEPREADRLLVPSADLVARHKSALLKVALKADAALRSGREGSLDEVIAAVDAVLFEGEGIARDEMVSARASLHERRQARSRPVRSKELRVASPQSQSGA